MSRHVIVHQFDPTRHVVGGIDGFIRELIAHAGDEHEFAVVGVQHDATALGHWRTVDVDGKPIEFMPVARLEAGNQRRRVPHSLRLAYGLARYGPRVRDAIVHSHRAEIGAVTALRYRRARRVQFLHGDSLQAFEWRTETMWRFAPRLYQVLERLAVRSADTTLVMSSSALARLRASAPRAALATNWYDGRYFHVDGSEHHVPPRIGWAGRLEPPKDPLRAVAVFAELRRRGVDFVAWIAGDGTLADDVRAAILEAGLDDAVRMVGVLSPAELAEQLRRSDVFLMTSRWEGVPRTALEALACGIPVVSTAVGEIPALVRDGANGFTSEGGSATELATAVVQAFGLERGAGVAASVADLEVRRVVPDILERIVAGGR